MDFSSVPHDVFERTQLVYVCSPGNPSGKVMSLEEWREIFALSDKYGFVIAADECYSEIYFDEATPPLGALQAAHLLGRHQLETPYKNLIIFSSLSKRSNVPGMRSGFVAGDEKIIEAFTLYRTYHGCAMNPVVQAASITAWNDEAHVIENRRLYAEKFNVVTELLSKTLTVEMPDAAFYLWLKTPIADTEFALLLYRDFNVTVLPGSLLARAAHGINPGENFVRLALVASLDECLEAAKRIQALASSL
jgi:N-succinyldiaminopimelate aminotransferase